MDTKTGERPPEHGHGESLQIKRKLKRNQTHTGRSGPHGVWATRNPNIKHTPRCQTTSFHMLTNFIALQRHKKYSRCFELAGSFRFAHGGRSCSRRTEQNGINLNKVKIKQKYFPFHLQFSYTSFIQWAGAAGILLPVAGWQAGTWAEEEVGGRKD